MAVDAVRPSRTSLPPLPQRVVADVSCTDPGLSLARDARGRIHLKGTAAGADGAGAELTLGFDGARISACLKPGTDAMHAVLLLEKALPEGYRLSVAEERAEVVLEVIRSPNAPPPGRSSREEPEPEQFTADAFVG
jgi:hypothetical protein